MLSRLILVVWRRAVNFCSIVRGLPGTSAIKFRNREHTPSMAINPAGRGPQLSAVVGFLLGLTTLAIILRSYCRVFLVKSFGWDDWFAAAAWVSERIFHIKRCRPLMNIGKFCMLLCICNLRNLSWHRSACLGHPASNRNTYWD
jgi:hypothetical protein